MTPGEMLIEATRLGEEGKIPAAFMLVQSFVTAVAKNAYERGYRDGAAGRKTETSPQSSE